MTHTDRLRAAVFERTGIAIDDKDPIVGVLAACAVQTEEIGERLLRRAHPVRVVLASAAVTTVFAAATGAAAWQVARAQAAAEHAEWLRAQADPRIAALVSSAEGKAALRLAELGVARLLATCSGRPSWQVQDGYCVVRTPDGQPDGFKVQSAAKARRG